LFHPNINEVQRLALVYQCCHCGGMNGYHTTQLCLNMIWLSIGP
jgi:hypothetical protein